jgi:hypothetical protein
MPRRTDRAEGRRKGADGTGGPTQEAIKSHEREARSGTPRYLGVCAVAQRDSPQNLSPFFRARKDISRFLYASDLSQVSSSFLQARFPSPFRLPNARAERERKLILAKCTVIKLLRDAVIM